MGRSKNRGHRVPRASREDRDGDSAMTDALGALPSHLRTSTRAAKKQQSRDGSTTGTSRSHQAARAGKHRNTSSLRGPATSTASAANGPRSARHNTIAAATPPPSSHSKRGRSRHLLPTHAPSLPSPSSPPHHPPPSPGRASLSYSDYAAARRADLLLHDTLARLAEQQGAALRAWADSVGLATERMEWQREAERVVPEGMRRGSAVRREVYDEVCRSVFDDGVLAGGAYVLGRVVAAPPAAAAPGGPAMGGGYGAQGGQDMSQMAAAGWNGVADPSCQRAAAPGHLPPVQQYSQVSGQETQLPPAQLAQQIQQQQANGNPMFNTYRQSEVVEGIE
ncbi:hypothetical protein NKR23_g7070 [Pleurostoma richardsiae]|uniref:Uncharacterized protein n=1 Tax=Pleurostoma richardsiae TaxID=41990 RepID=A0AA38RJ11_9PEZI|nr:hypothetical protein NKR23_g7070 [Pleurostoma richardsiae]